MIRCIKYKFFGGNLKFLAVVCGIEAANVDHACIWCKCPKNKRSDGVRYEGVVVNYRSRKRARTIKETTE